MSPYVRTAKTASGAMAVQFVQSSRRGSRDIEHVGSAHDVTELEALKAAARQRLSAGQGELDLGLVVAAAGGPLPVMSSRMGHLLDALAHVCRVLGFGDVTGADEVFRQLVLGDDQVARRRTSRIAEAPRSTDNPSSHPASIHWNGQNQLPGW